MTPCDSGEYPLAACWPPNMFNFFSPLADHTTGHHNALHSLFWRRLPFFHLSDLSVSLCSKVPIGLMVHGLRPSLLPSHHHSRSGTRYRSRLQGLLWILCTSLSSNVVIPSSCSLSSYVSDLSLLTIPAACFWTVARYSWSTLVHGTQAAEVWPYLLHTEASEFLPGFEVKVSDDLTKYNRDIIVSKHITYIHSWAAYHHKFVKVIRLWVFLANWSIKATNLINALIFEATKQ